VTFDSTSGPAKDLMNSHRDDLKDLNDTKAGADWDKKFLDKAIDDHQHVLDKLQDASKNTTDPELRASLEKTTGKVQEHLTKAQDLKAKMK
jgi:putative membrane protein